MNSPSPQSMQAPTQSPGCFRLHTEASNHISFGHSVSIGRDSRERHAYDAVMLGDFGDEIGPQRVSSVVEDYNDVVAVADFADCADHREGTQA